MHTAQVQAEVLAYIPSPSQGVWHLAGIPIRAYALCIIIGIVIAVWWSGKRWIARGGREGEVLDVAIWAVPFGLLGGRLYHLATDWDTYFGDGPKEPIDALKIWDGGLGIWGAVLVGALGAWIGARRMGINLSPFADAIAPPILLAQAIGRLGNYFNQELYGDKTDLPWGLEIFYRSSDGSEPDPSIVDGKSTGQLFGVYHPTFLYELIWNVLIVVALVLIDRRFRIGHGRLFALYVAGYCVGRFVIETMRSDHATEIFNLRINLFTAALVFICAAIYVVVAPKGRETWAEVYHEYPGDLPGGDDPDGDGPEDGPVDVVAPDSAEVGTKASVIAETVALTKVGADQAKSVAKQEPTKQESVKSAASGDKDADAAKAAHADVADAKTADDDTDASAAQASGSATEKPEAKDSEAKEPVIAEADDTDIDTDIDSGAAEDVVATEADDAAKTDDVDIDDEPTETESPASVFDDVEPGESELEPDPPVRARPRRIEPTGDDIAVGSAAAGVAGAAWRSGARKLKPTRKTKPAAEDESTDTDPATRE